MRIVPHIAFTVLLSLGSLLAQDKFERSRLFDRDDGLLNDRVRRVRKGPDGFLWMATFQGLCRFDGSAFTYYQHDEDDPESIMDNRVTDILPTSDKVWAATDLGVSVLDLATGVFKNYRLGPTGKVDSLIDVRTSEVDVLFQDRDKDIWIGSRYNGLFRYDSERDDFQAFPYVGERNYDFIRDKTPLLGIRSIAENRYNDSLIYAGTAVGLLEVNKISGKVEWFAFEPQPGQPADLNVFRRIYFHTDSLLYAGSWQPGLRIFDPGNKEITVKGLGHSEGSDILKSGVSRFFQKGRNEIWVTTGYGLILYDSKKDDITYWKRNQLRKGVYYGVDCIDERGRVWFPAINGLHCFDPIVQQFQVYSYEGLNNYTWGFAYYLVKNPEGKEITVFPRNADGLFHLDEKSRKWTKTSFPGRFAPGKGTLAKGMVIDPQGNYTLASGHGIFTYFPKSGRIRRLLLPENLSPSTYSDIFWDSRGWLWIGIQSKGLVRWDPETKTLRSFETALEDNGVDQSLSGFGGLIEDSYGNIWFKRKGGMGGYLYSKDTIVNFLYERDKKKNFRVVNSIAEDRKGRIWVSGEEGRLGYIDSHFPEMGIIWRPPSSEFYGIRGLNSLRADADGNIWCLSDKALVKIDATDLEMKTHSYKYGKKDLEIFSFNILPGGEFVFGERNQIAVFRPGRLRVNEELPIPYLTEIKVMDKFIEKKVTSEYIEELNLDPNQNSFSFGFSAKSFTLANDNTFRFRLKEIKGAANWLQALHLERILGSGRRRNSIDAWTSAGDRRFQNYTNIPSGEYVFQLQVVNNEGKWSEKDTLELPIFIATHWWTTWWFFLGVVALLVASAFLFYRSRLNQVRKSERIRSEFNKRLAKVEMTALLSQMNPHFLFNCLNSIDSYIVKNKTREASEYLNDFARLMRLILHHSRSNYVSLKDELEALELYMQMESLRFKDKFNYSIYIDEGLDPEAVDIPPMLIQPYIENAIWHGLMHKKDKSEGKVSLSLLQDNGVLRCIVEDNGIGREKAMEIKARKSDTGKKSMGMSITRDRIALINQMYNMEAKVRIFDLKDGKDTANGTRVVLEIPV